MIKKVLIILSLFLPGFIKIIIYKIIGFSVGKNVKLSFFSMIYANEIKLGNDVEIRAFVFINVHRLILGNNSIISYGVQIKGEKDFIAGDNCMIGIHTIIHCDENVKMGFYSAFGPRNVVYTHGSFLPVNKGYPSKLCDVILEDYVWLGMSISCLPGTYIESNSMILPGVILNGRIKGNTIIGINRNIYIHKNIDNVKRQLIKNGYLLVCEIIEYYFNYYHILYNKINNRYVFKIKKDQFAYEPNIDGSGFSLIYKNKKIKYNLVEYFVDYSSLKINRNMLLLLRNKYGIILRNIY